MHKQVYIYVVPYPSPRVLDGQFGMAWGVGDWPMTWFYERIESADATQLRARASVDLTTLFASRFSAGISLGQMLSLDAIRAYTRRATGAKFPALPKEEWI